MQALFLCAKLLLSTRCRNRIFSMQNSSMTTPLRSLAIQLSVIWVCFVAHAQEAPQLGLPRVKLGAGMFQIDTQVALTQDQHTVGLMFRKEMPQHEGMLFVFEQTSQQCFWMKNTVLPLTAAFVADDGTIVNLADMTPLSLDSHCSKAPVRYVLEMNKGWFAKKGIKPGTKLTGTPFNAR